MNDHETLARAERAEKLLNSELWMEAWTAYRKRLMQIIEEAKTDDEALEARRMLRAGVAAREHLERIVADGAFAASNIELATGKKPRWMQLLAR